MKTWTSLEHKIYRKLKSLPLAGRTLLVGLSGGADSTCLLILLKKISGPLGFELRALHCHHGEQDNLEFRDRSAQWCRDLCEKWQVPYKIVKNLQLQLFSEAELRVFRQQAFQEELASLTGSDQNSEERAQAVLCLGHHRDDLLETRLLRLIRGTGPSGLQAMNPWQDLVLRPLLETSRAEIEAYLKSQAQNFLLDPSCDDLRSYVRQQILGPLEQRSPGASVSIARSLELIASALQEGKNPQQSDGCIERRYFLTLSYPQRTQLLASYLWGLGVQNYSQGMIEEINRYLDKRETIHTFSIAGLSWHIDAKNIRASLP